MKTKIPFTLLIALAVASLASSVEALERSVALGTGGEVYQAKVGTYSSLFPAGQDAPAANAVLAIEITRPGGQTARLLVPGTEGQDQDRSPALFFEQSSNTLFVLWERRVNAVQAVLALASFDGSRWEKPFQISSNPFSTKIAPQLTVTHDTYQDADSDDNPVTRHRTILQLLWEEENQQSGFDVLYSPLILEDGAYLGSNPVYNLSALVSEGDLLTASEDQAPLEPIRTPVMQRGRDARTLTVGFVSASARRLVTLEVDILPQELGRLSEKARAFIIDMGQRGTGRRSLAEKTRAALLDEGGSFQPEVTSTIASQVFELILASEAEPIEALGDKARAFIIDMGCRLSGRGLRPNNPDTKSQIERIERESLGEGEPLNTPHLLRFRVASSRPVPVVGAGAIKLFVSETGDDALISWATAERVFFRLSTSDGWTIPKEIELTETVTLEKAYELLESKVRNR